VKGESFFLHPFDKIWILDVELNRIGDGVVLDWLVLCQFLVQRVPMVFLLNQTRQLIFVLMLSLQF
jgi:hypothetical protein